MLMFDQHLEKNPNALAKECGLSQLRSNSKVCLVLAVCADHSGGGGGSPLNFSDFDPFTTPRRSEDGEITLFLFFLLMFASRN